MAVSPLSPAILLSYSFICLNGVQYNIIGIIIEVILVFVELIKIYRISNSLADSLYGFFVGNTVPKNILDCISDWAIIIGIIPFIVILALLIFNIRNSRRRRALSRIHDWAQNGVLIFSDYRQRDGNLRETQSVRTKGIRVMLDVLKQHSNVALTEAKIVGGELETNTKETIQKFYIHQ